MGKSSRKRPHKLGVKLLQIREYLDLSQSQMLKLVDPTNENRSSISLWETGRREPPLLVLLKYAKSVGISTDILIDDTEKLSLRVTPRLSN